MSGQDSHNQALGGRIRSIRTAAGITADELADAARRSGLGFRWDRSTVSRIEAGARVLTWWELVNLPQVFAAAGYALRLRDFFDPPLDVAGRAVGWEAIEGPPDGYSSLPERLRQPWMLTEAERRAARSLGVRPRTLDLVSWRRWGRRFVAERDQRAAERDQRAAEREGTDATPKAAESARRWAARRMLAELRGAVNRDELDRLDGLSDAEFDVEQRRNGVD
jgi:transcriptional regulator with XRE-family HTH domain